MRKRDLTPAQKEYRHFDVRRGIIIKTLIFGDPTSGWPSMVCIMVMIGGIQLFCMGIIGQYLAKTYLESKNRPVYILAENSLKK